MRIRVFHDFSDSCQFYFSFKEGESDEQDVKGRFDHSVAMQKLVCEENLLKWV